MFVPSNRQPRPDCRQRYEANLRKDTDMGIGRIIGLALLALGVVLLIFGFAAADSFADQFSKAFTGEYTDRTMFYIIGGAVSAVVGLGLMLFGGRATAER
jgi:hypothetical protein